MVRIRCDGTEREIDLSGCESVGDAIARCLHPESDRVVTRVEVDGRDLSSEDRELLESIALGDVARVDVETDTPTSVALATLASADEYLGRIREALAQTSSLLRGGKIEQGNRLYADLLDALSVLVFAVASAGQQLGDAGRTLHEIESDLQPWLDALLDAQKLRDWVRVADYLEYEIDPIMGDWRRRLHGVQRSPVAQAMEAS